MENVQPKRILILGGGFAGLNAAKALGNSKFDVWLIDKTNHHLFQPLLYQVASAALSPGDIAVPIRQILSPYENVTVLMGEIDSIDKERRQVVLKNGDPEIKFQAVIAAGNWELDAAWSSIIALLNDPHSPKPLLLAAIGAVGSIRHAEAREVLVDLADSDDEEIAEAVDEALATADMASDEDNGEEEEWVN